MGLRVGWAADWVSARLAQRHFANRHDVTVFDTNSALLEAHLASRFDVLVLRTTAPTTRTAPTASTPP